MLLIVISGNIKRDDLMQVIGNGQGAGSAFFHTVKKRGRA